MEALAFIIIINKFYFTPSQHCTSKKAQWFSNISISQGGAATCLTCGSDTSKDHYIASFVFTTLEETSVAVLLTTNAAVKNKKSALHGSRYLVLEADDDCELCEEPSDTDNSEPGSMSVLHSVTSPLCDTLCEEPSETDNSDPGSMSVLHSVTSPLCDTM